VNARGTWNNPGSLCLSLWSPSSFSSFWHGRTNALNSWRYPFPKGCKGAISFGYVWPIWSLKQSSTFISLFKTYFQHLVSGMASAHSCGIMPCSRYPYPEGCKSCAIPYNLAMYARGVCGMWHWLANQNNWIFHGKVFILFWITHPNALLAPHSDHQGEFLSCNAKVQDDHLCDPAHMQARIVEKHSNE
jgi:hypothetical protein